MASLAKDLEHVYETPTRRIQCKTAILLNTLEDEDRQALTKVLEDLSITAKQIVDWLRKHGHAISADSVRRHRKRSTGAGCQCPRQASA